MNFNKWIDTLVAEKNIDLDEDFTVAGKVYGMNFFTYGVIVEAIKTASAEEKKAIKNMIVKIDFLNGDIKHYFRHLAQALAI